MAWMLLLSLSHWSCRAIPRCVHRTKNFQALGFRILSVKVGRYIPYLATLMQRHVRKTENSLSKIVGFSRANPSLGGSGPCCSEAQSTAGDSGSKLRETKMRWLACASATALASIVVLCEPRRYGRKQLSTALQCQSS